MNGEPKIDWRKIAITPTMLPLGDVAKIAWLRHLKSGLPETLISGLVRAHVLVASVHAKGKAEHPGNETGHQRNGRPERFVKPQRHMQC
jgi:hypothetical protein